MEAGAWQAGPPLRVGRYQAGCTVWADGAALIAAGGCEAWGCLSSVEMLRVGAEGSEWEELPPLGIARRGCGAAVLGDRLYVVGGADGQRSLTSVEVLDLSAPGRGWASGPPLHTPRANVRCVNQGGVLIVVGGFSGKNFLPTMEFLDPGPASPSLPSAPPPLTGAALQRRESGRRRRRNGSSPVSPRSQNAASSRHWTSNNRHFEHGTRPMLLLEYRLRRVSVRNCPLLFCTPGLLHHFVEFPVLAH